MTLRLTLLAIVTAAGLGAAPPQTPIVVFETAMGNIEIEVDAVRAPRTAANFLRYVDAGLYNHGRFHRTVRPETETRKDLPIEVIQASIDAARRREGFDPIAIETTKTTGILHKNGVLSMARAGVDSATSDFFICIGDQPLLDFGGARNADGQGFAAFGRVLSGMEVVKKIQTAAVRTGTQTLEPPIAITRARRK